MLESVKFSLRLLNKEFSMVFSHLITFYTPITSTSTFSHTTGQMMPLATKIVSGVYQHYKGNYYLVFFVARHTETEEEMVVYQSLYGEYRIWSRPLTMFLETVEYNGKTQPRFTWITQSSEAHRFVEKELK